MNIGSPQSDTFKRREGIYPGQDKNRYSGTSRNITMIVNKLTIENFRNYQKETLEPGSGFNLLVGKNAQGKSNCIEALYLLGLGRPYRTSREEDALPPGAGYSRVAGEFTEGEISFSLEIIWDNHSSGVLRKIIRHNKTPVSRLSDFIGLAPMVLLTVDDLDIVRGDPQLRRRFLDLLCSRVNPSYVVDLREYKKVLEARNAWLKIPPGKRDPRLGEVYLDRLVFLGAGVMLSRMDIIKQLREEFESLYREIFRGEPPAVSYRSTALKPGKSGQEDVRDSFRKTLGSLKRLEDRRAHTMAGPHRDDLEMISYNGPLKKFASLGEIRTAAAVLKLAEAVVLSRKLQREPVILMDDCLNEFDPDRVRLFLNHLAGNRQVIYAATCIPRYFDGIDGISIFQVNEGRITPCS